MTAGELLNQTRRRHRLSQRTLALRAGTTQGWISAIEQANVQPTTDMLRRLLLAMGEELVLESRRLPSDWEHDPLAFAENRGRSPEERMAEGLAWMRLSS